jgi:2-oxoisovalerate dehydrogenase E1 component
MNMEEMTLSPIAFQRYGYDNETLLGLYKALVKPRLIEEKMLILLRQGRISKWFSGIGQEAISVGTVMALAPEEYILPMHRNLGVFTGRGLPLHRLFAQFQGKASGYTKGRDRSFHFGTKDHHIVGMISHLGPQLAVANGIALADRLAGTPKITLAFSGDGATSEGDFHEALNVAAVWELPVIFLIENNGYGLSTPNNEQYRCKDLIDKGIGYGMKAVQVDGNNILDMYHTIRVLKQEMLENPHPVLVEAMTFRMRGHEEASGTKYIPQHLFELWAVKDPVANYARYLREEGVLDEATDLAIRQEIKEEMEAALETAFQEDPVQADTGQETGDVYAPFVQPLREPSPSATRTERRYIDAISDALKAGMETYPELVLMGQDIAEYGGAFKITEGFVSLFGKERVRNTPLCESAIVGAALGLSIKNQKAMVEMQFADFVTCGFNQIVNNLAKIHYRWGQHADVVIRMPTGGGVAAGPFHSQSNEAWFTHTPGLKVVYPSNPYDAKGLLLAALEDPNPYLYFEHKALYRSVQEAIPDGYYTVPVGKARLVSTGEDLSIITYGMGVHWAREIMAGLPGYQADILDLRTLLPWDKEAVQATVKKTGRVLICHEDCTTGSLSGDIAAWVAEHCFEWLDAPVMREGSLDTPVPFAPNLEKNFLPKERIREKINQLLAY